MVQPHRSSRPSVRSLTGRSLQLLFLSILASLVMVITGCGSGATSGEPTKSISSLAVSPSSVSLAVGATQQLTATATYSDGSTANVSSQASWASSNGALASVNSSGMVTTVGAGSVTVTASFSGVNGSTQVTVTQAAKTVTAIAITPATVTLAVGSTQQLTATATYSDGSTGDVSSQASWTSSNTVLASVSATGLVTAAGTGSVTITGTVTGVSGTSQITIPQATKTLTSIAVTPATAAVAVGATQQLVATATYSDGSTANVSANVSWTSSQVAVASVNASGLVTGVAGGSATVTASLNGVSGTSQITVPQPTLALISIAITPATANVAVGATQQLVATATYSNNSTANVSATVTWTSSKATVASVSPSGLVTGVAAGSAAISATFNGVSGMSQITVPQSTATLTSIAVTPPTANVAVGATQQLTATATYSNGSTANVSTTVTWTSSKATLASVSASGLVTGVAAGSATISATLNSISGMSQVTVPISTKTLTSIAVTPTNPSIAVAATQQFTATATYSDNSTANITSQVSWTSSNTSFATVNSSGLATGVAAGSVTVTATLNSVSGATGLTVTAKTLTAIAITPNPATAALGTTQQLTAMGTYKDGSTGNITSTVNWTPANIAVVTVSSAGLATPVAAGSTTVTASLSGVTASVSFTVTIASGTGVSISTWQADVNRSGLNAGEMSLSPSNVSATTFGKLFSYALDGYEYGEPLLMSNVTINNAVHNVVYAATEHDSVYAFDADNYGTGAPLWTTSLLKINETPMTNGPIKPYQGVTSTPVIDPSTNTIYVVSAQTIPGSSATFRLNALDITTGAQKAGSPVTIQATVAGTNSDSVNGMVSLTTSCVQRAALLLENGTIYMGFGGCHSGWLLGYNAQTLQQTAVFNASPNLNGEGTYASAGGIWMGGGGPVADSAGNIYVSTGNGPWDTTQKAYADSVLKFSPQLQVMDYFTPDNYAYMNCNDADLAAGGVLLIPGTTELIAGGKTGMMYLVNTSNLGQEQADDAGVTQELYYDSGLIGSYTQSCTDTSGTHTSNINSYEIFGTPAYFNQSIYLGVTPTAANVPAGIRQFTYSAGTLTPYHYTTPSIQAGSYGTTPFISANGTGNGVLWMIDHGVPLQSGTSTAATLRAYDANDLSNELYDSSMNTGDAPGYGIKFTSPIVGNGKVYMSTGHNLTTTANPQGEIDVYGLK